MEKKYYDDLQKCIDACKVISKALPHTHTSFMLNSFNYNVRVDNVNREDVHKLAKLLNTTFWFREGCNGKKTAISGKNSLGIKIILLTNIPCPTCRERIKQFRLNLGKLSLKAREQLKPQPESKLAQLIAFLPLLENLYLQSTKNLPDEIINNNLWFRRLNKIIFNLQKYLFNKPEQTANLFFTYWIHPNKPFILPGHNPDYSQDCAGGGSCTCQSSGYPCTTNSQCVFADNCTCTCPAPLANSHQVTDNCAAPDPNSYGCTCDPRTGECVANTCDCTATGACTGTCDYDCDAGYTWNGTECVPIAVVKTIGNGLTWIVG